MGRDNDEGSITGSDIAGAADNDKGETYTSTMTHNNQIELTREEEIIGRRRTATTIEQEVYTHQPQ